MHLIYLWAPLLFFLLCVIEMTLAPNNNTSWTKSNYRKNCVIKQRLPFTKAEKYGFNSLDYVSEITLDLDGLRNMTKYQYIYVKTS